MWDMTQPTRSMSDPASDPTSASARAAGEGVDAFFDLLADGWKTNDGVTVADFFVDDGSLINPFGERADGRGAIAAMYAEYFAGLLRGTTTTFILEAVRTVATDHAFVDGQQSILAAGGEVVLLVHLATLLRRHGDSWRFVDVRPYIIATPPG